MTKKTASICCSNLLRSANYIKTQQQAKMPIFKKCIHKQRLTATRTNNIDRIKNVFSCERTKAKWMRNTLNDILYTVQNNIDMTHLIYKWAHYRECIAFCIENKHLIHIVCIVDSVVIFSSSIWCCARL